MAQFEKINIENMIYCIILNAKIHNFNIQNKNNTIDNLRKFHNTIKNKLIFTYSKLSNANHLMDIACGRGGDLNKWINPQLNLKYILAFDSHAESIFSSTKKGQDFDGAIARFLNLKGKNRKLPFVLFKHLDILNTDILKNVNNIDNSKSYDIISCQFAFHYFTQNTNTINNVLYVVSSKLKKGGYFIGTATDGDLIHNILKKGNVNISMLDIIQKENNNYVFNIDTSKNNSTQNYFQLKGASSEFFIFKNLLKDIALIHNLILIEYKSFHEYYTEFKQKKLLYANLTSYEMIISFLNFSFVFQKQ